MQNINKKNSEEYIVDRKVESVKTFNMKKAVDKGSKWIFLLSALIAVFSLLLIMGFVFYKGLRPFFAEGYSFVGFITGIDWYPSCNYIRNNRSFAYWCTYWFININFYF